MYSYLLPVGFISSDASCGSSSRHVADDRGYPLPLVSVTGDQQYTLLSCFFFSVTWGRLGRREEREMCFSRGVLWRCRETYLGIVPPPVPSFPSFLVEDGHLMGFHFGCGGGSQRPHG